MFIRYFFAGFVLSVSAVLAFDMVWYVGILFFAFIAYSIVQYLRVFGEEE